MNATFQKELSTFMEARPLSDVRQSLHDADLCNDDDDDDDDDVPIRISKLHKQMSTWVDYI